MLILVGVTVNVALNGGLFETANKAAKQTQKEADREILQAAVIAALNEQLKIENANAILKNLPDGWDVTGPDGGPYICTSPKGNIFIVDVNGEITEPPNLPKGLVEGKEFPMDADQDGTDETWIVLYKTANEIEVISKNTMGNLALGATDEEAIKNATDIDGSKTVEPLEKAIYSYNNAIDRINNYCKDLIKIGNLGVRSVGSKPSDPSYKNTNPYAIEHLDEWSDQNAWTTYGVLGEGADSNYNEDYTKMNTLGIKTSGDTKEYWLASRYVNEIWRDSSSYGFVYFDVWFVGDDGRLGGDLLWNVNSNGDTWADRPAYAVRPVVKLPYK